MYVCVHAVYGQNSPCTLLTRLTTARAVAIKTREEQRLMRVDPLSSMITKYCLRAEAYR